MLNTNFTIKITIFYFILSFNFLVAFENKIVARVGSSVLSSYELKNKIKTILFLSNQSLSQENINITKSQAIRLLINQKIKKEELKKFEIDIEDNLNVVRYIENISSKYNTNLQGFKKLFNENDLNYEAYNEEIKVELAWQKLIFNLFNDRVNFDEGEIDEEIKKIIEKKESIEEYKLAEIEVEILIGNNLETQKKIKEIENQINKIGFENTAIKFSTSSSAFEGGDLGWIRSNAMSSKILKIVKDMNAGDVSSPISTSNSILFLKLVDKKVLDLQTIDIEDMKNKVLIAKKNELLNIYSNNYLSQIKNNAFIEFNE